MRFYIPLFLVSLIIIPNCFASPMRKNILSDFGVRQEGNASIDGEATSVIGSLKKEQVLKVVTAYMGQIEYCYERQLQKEPKLHGKILINVAIDFSGAVKNATPQSSSIGSPTVDSCVSAVFRRMPFPAQNIPTEAKVSIKFNVAKKSTESTSSELRAFKTEDAPFIHDLCNSNPSFKTSDTFSNICALKMSAPSPNAQDTEFSVSDGKSYESNLITFKKLNDQYAITHLHLNESIKAVPDSIGNLKNLQALRIEILTNTVPDSIQNLVQLNTLEIFHGGSEVVRIPKWFEKMTELTRLSISNASFKNVPELFKHLKNLKELSLPRTIYYGFPAYFIDLKELPLEKFSICCGQFTVLPKWINELKTLKELDISSTRITTLPDTIGNLENLETLRLMFNRSFVNVPDSVCNLQKLKALELNDNNLSEVPNCVGKLKNLTILRLSKNKLKKIPDGITELTNLNHLYIDNNPISSIPSDFTKLKNNGNLVHVSVPEALSDKDKKLVKEIEESNRHYD